MAVDPDSDAESGNDGDSREWRFSLQDIEQRNGDGGESTETDDGATNDGDDGGNVAGTLSPAEGIEPGEIDIENAVFVLVGVVLAVLALVGFANVLP